MSKARDMAEILSTPPAIYSTDAEVAATYLTQASASSAYLTRSSASTIYEGSPNRNLIINGDMQVAQRGTSVASITSGGYRTTDRWNFEPSNMGTWTMSQENDAPSGSGFRNSAKVLCTTADASPAAGDYLGLGTRFEGQNLQQVKKGTAAAEQLTLSFWVKANVTGTYIVSLEDVDNTRYTAKSYTINTSATWEKKTITFPADTTGVLDNDNGFSLQLFFWLGAGTNFTSGTLQQTWGTTNYTNGTTVSGQVNLASATNNYWQITGVQLEVGDTATPFEFLPAQQELAQCQRYYQVIGVTSGADFPLGRVTGSYKMIGSVLLQTMRATPTATLYYDRDNAAITTISASQTTTTSVWVDAGASGTFVDFHAILATAEL